VLDLGPEVVSRERHVLPLDRRDVENLPVGEWHALGSDIGDGSGKVDRVPKGDGVDDEVQVRRPRLRSWEMGCHIRRPPGRSGLDAQPYTANPLPSLKASQKVLSVQSCRNSHTIPPARAPMSEIDELQSDTVHERGTDHAAVLAPSEGLCVGLL